MSRAIAFFVIAAVLSVAVGIGWSEYYWRYPFAPPPLLPEFGLVRSVQSVSSVAELNPEANKLVEIEPVDAEVLDSPHAWYLAADWRLPLKLEADGLDCQSAPPSAAELASKLWHAANDAGLLVTGTDGYPDTATLWGHIAVTTLVDGREVILASVAGYEYSNDHYPYYELVAVFEEDALRIIKSQSFFFDVAGIEGATWLGMSMLACFVITPVAGIPLLFRDRRKAATTL
jgi:hypothetical protein